MSASSTDNLYGAIEAGGTKFVCAVATGPKNIVDQIVLPTETPQVTLPRVVEFFRQAGAKHGSLRAIGIGSFGPIDVHTSSPKFGHITATPKPHWSDTDLVGPLRAEFKVPVAFDTDVNAAALGEARWGAGQETDVLVYLTVGTGIGGGVLHAGHLVHGLVHPEIGHQRIPHDRERDSYVGHCPFHGDCFEGLASGAAMTDRWKCSGRELGDDHPAWKLEAHYLGLGITNIAVMLSPDRIIVGGGVMKHPRLHAMVRQEVTRTLAGYVKHPRLEGDLSDYIVPPGLEDRSGILGALAMAMQE
jgi:fructokinase